MINLTMHMEGVELSLACWLGYMMLGGNAQLCHPLLTVVANVAIMSLFD